MDAPQRRDRATMKTWERTLKGTHLSTPLVSPRGSPCRCTPHICRLVETENTTGLQPVVQRYISLRALPTRNATTDLCDCSKSTPYQQSNRSKVGRAAAKVKIIYSQTPVSGVRGSDWPPFSGVGSAGSSCSTLFSSVRRSLSGSLPSGASTFGAPPPPT